MTAASSRSSGSTNSIAPGLTIDGRYRVLRQLGSGGAGSVFVVDDLASGRTCALKLLQQSTSPRVAALFEREFYILSSLRHPNVVEAYEYGTYRERHYYTMELLEGHDLSGLAPLPYALALSYVCDAARALSAVHARHVLHRDLSPRNLWICDSGVLKLLDFGASADFGPSAEVAGTPPFIAPEALAGQPLDQRTDLYALGALLYWLLVGQHAYPARAIRDLPSRWREAPRAPSAQVARLRRDDLPSIPEDVDGLVLSLLSADPAARPATAGELIDRIVAMTGRKQDDACHTQAKYLLERPAFAGRARERNFFGRALESVVAGRGGATLIEAARGQGGSRLLAEFALMARLDGAIPIVLDGAPGSCPRCAVLQSNLPATRYATGRPTKHFRRAPHGPRNA